MAVNVRGQQPRWMQILQLSDVWAIVERNAYLTLPEFFPFFTMGKTWGKSSDESSHASPLDEIWPKLEAKLNTWAVNTLPNIVKDLIKSQAITAVDEYISSPEFTQTINESIKFDTDELKDKFKATEAKITKLETGKPELLERIDELEQYTRRIFTFSVSRSQPLVIQKILTLW